MAQTVPFITAGRFCLGLVGVGTIVGGYLADFNHTHLKNPNWPPHARFHNAQTMSMGLCLGLLTLYLLSKRTANYPEYLFLAAISGSMYFVTGLSAGLYPGTAFTDPEFVIPGGFNAPQIPGFLAITALAWTGYFLEMNRMAKLKRV